MKKEYLEKLELSKKYLEEDDPNLTEGENEKNFWIGHDLMEQLVQTKDVEVLVKLLEFFNKKNENGVCETLMNDIWDNYSAEQIIEAVSQKFDYLVENDLNRFACLSQAFFCYSEPEAFVKFRNMFNKVKPKRAEEYISATAKWVEKYFPSEINLLREDMKKWQP